MAKQVPTTTVDLDALLAANRKRAKASKCSVGVFLNSLDDPDVRAKLEAALDDESHYSAENLCAVFEHFGYEYSASPIGRHRVRGCQCRPR